MVVVLDLGCCGVWEVLRWVTGGLRFGVLQSVGNTHSPRGVVFHGPHTFALNQPVKTPLSAPKL